MLRPGPRLLPLLLAAGALALAAAWWRPAGWLALGAALGIAVLAVAEARLLRRIRLSCERPARLAVSLGRDAILPTRLSHDGDAPLHLELRTCWPDPLGGGAGGGAGTCTPGSHLDLPAVVHGHARGAGTIPAPVVAWSRFGLMERIAAAGVPVAVAVLPDLGAVRQLRTQLDALFLRGLGNRLAPRAGQGREFDRLREYVQGDDWRHLAWKASARRGALIVREHRVERAQDVLLCLDRGHRMAARVASAQGLLTRLDHGVNAAVLTAWLCNRNEDRVGLLAFAAEVERGVPQGRGAAHLAAVTRFASTVEASWLHTDYRVLAAELKRRLRHRTLILLTTVLPERGADGELLAAIRMLVPRHLPLVLVLTDPVLEAAAHDLPADAAGLGRTLVAADLVDGRRSVIADLRRLGALVVETTPVDAGIAAVNAYLDVKRRQLL